MVARPANPIPVALRVARVFEDLGIPYLIGGSVASTLHGEPRGTLDVDFAVHLDPEDADRLASALSDGFLVDASSIREAAEQKRMFNFVDTDVYMKIDVHVREAAGHSAEEIARAKPLRLSDDGSARVATAEDVLLRKLWWYRAGDEVSDRQWRDAAGIVRTNPGQLDRDYLRRWAADLGVTDLLDRLLDETS